MPTFAACYLAPGNCTVRTGCISENWWFEGEVVGGLTENRVQHHFIEYQKLADRIFSILSLSVIKK